MCVANILPLLYPKLFTFKNFKNTISFLLITFEKGLTRTDNFVTGCRTFQDASFKLLANI